ncbi:MAG: nrgB [Sporomusa sp.]|jgi:nitrogen regulatory protein P-II 1|nr:nrgB [Sporomusa sp.]
MKQITKVDIITRPEKLEALKEAMNKIKVTGMTVTQVYGCGLSKGHKEVYRGQEYSINLVPKVKVEIVVCEVPVEQVIEAAKSACRTGKIGDGKIFVYPVSNAVRIRTGEEGDIAIIDPKNT